MGNTITLNVSQSPSNNYRFLNIDKELLETLPPIGDYKTLPLVSLEQAISSLVSLVPNIKEMVRLVKDKCKNPADNLTTDESASIMLYSLECIPLEASFYIILNKTLRDKNRQNFQNWLSYLKLFTTALSKISSTISVVYCGVKLNLLDLYPKERNITWWGFSSCMTSLQTLQSNEFLGENGPRTIFYIECFSGKNIQSHSYYSTRNEIILLSQIQLKVHSSCKDNNGLSVIHLKEIVQFSSSILSSLSISEKSIESSAPIDSYPNQRNNNNTNVTTTEIQTTGSTQASMNRSWLNWFRDTFEVRQDSHTDDIAIRRYQRNYLALVEKRRSCPECGRKDRVYCADFLFEDPHNDFIGRVNSFHIILFPRLASLMFATGLIRYSCFIFLYPTVFCFSAFALICRSFSGRNRLVLFSMGISSVSYMFYRFTTGISALVDDLKNDNLTSVLVQRRVGAQSKFCFFRSWRDICRYFYICTYKH